METKMISTRIAEARKKMNISQAQLAEKLFISAQAVGKWERGESMPDIVTLNRLADIFQVDLNFFLGKEQAENHIKPTLTDTSSQRRDWDMSSSNWVDANFSGLKNLHEKFTNSNMRKCKFIGSDLSELILKKNSLIECDFSNSNMMNCQIQKSTISKDVFDGSCLNRTEFDSCEIKECSFKNSDLKNVRFIASSFNKNLVEHTKWDNVSFRDSQLMDMTFSSNMDNCTFENCDFKSVVMQDITLTNTFFKNNILKGLKFKNCRADRFSYEFLKSGKANMEGVKLFEAKLDK